MFSAVRIAAHGDHEASPPRPSRTRAALAVLIDFMTLAAALGLGLALATVWLLARSEAGAVDPRSGDALLGWALWSAAAPAWTVWQWQALRLDARTRGARVVQVGPREPRTAGVLELLMHPAALPLLSWMTACLVLTPVWVVHTPGLVLAVLVIALTLIALASALRGVLRPEATPLYTSLARRLGALGRGRA